MTQLFVFKINKSLSLVYFWLIFRLAKLDSVFNASDKYFAPFSPIELYLFIINELDI